MGNIGAAEAVKKPNPVGEPAILQILAKHPGNHFIDLCNIATEIGMVHSGCCLSDGRAREVVLDEFNRRKIDDVHWSMVHGSFLNGRGSVISTAEVRARYSPVAANDNEEPTDSPKSGDSLAALTNPGGLVGELVDWIVSSSSRPSRELALSAVIPFIGALLGRRFASPTDLRTNFYVVALADSATAKTMLAVS